VNKVADSRWKILSAVGLVWLVLDQLTKAAVTACIPLNHGFSVIPGFFDLVHVLNRGAAFGFLNRSDTDWQFWLFLAAAVAVTVVIIGMVRTAAYSRLFFFGCGSILGGAIGNLIDRIRARAVTDFLDLYVGQWHWPAFNVADIAICLGVAAAGFVLLREAREEARQKGE
jgi:signal peptidase II